MDKRLFEQGIIAASASPRARDLLSLLQGFLLSRQVEGATPETLKTYQQRLGNFLKWLAGQECADIRMVQQTHIYHYLIQYQEKGRSPAYVNGLYRTLRAFFNWCVLEEFIGKSPLRTMKAPKMPKKGKPFIFEPERDRLLAQCYLNGYTGARNAAILWLFWSTGMRLNELATLQIADVNWDKSKIRVFGKGNKERYVPFTKEAKKALWRYLSFRRDDLPQLWLSEERKPLNKWGINIAVRRIIADAGLHGQIKDACHIFRRSWAMRNLKAGIPIKFVQLAGGWESITTLDGYVRAMQSEDALGADWR